MLRTASRRTTFVTILILFALSSGALQVGAAPGRQSNGPSEQGVLKFVGSLQIAEERPVTLIAGGPVQEVLVDIGDQVEAGQVLMNLDPTFLDFAVSQAELSLEMARVNLLEQGQTSSESEIAIAEANLELAKARLAKLEVGPTEDQLAAAEASAAAAWARYNELRAGPTPERLAQLKANLEKAQIARDEAQRAYDKVAWRGDVGQTPQAANLQRATIDYNAAKAAFDEATRPARQSELQSALAAAHRAQDELNKLREWPDEAEIKLAQAQVASAEAALKKVKELAGSSSLRSAELRVQQALIGLEEAQLRRDNAAVRAPVSGTVLEVNAKVGQQVGAGSVVAVIGDTSNMEVIVQVTQEQIGRIAPGAPATVTRFDDATIQAEAEVVRIAPVGTPGAGTAAFPVTVRLTGVDAEQFRPGMFVSVEIATQ